MPKPKKRRRKNKVGRPTLLTPQLSKRICSYILAGSYEYVAAQACGIDRMTFMEWMRRGQDRDRRPTSKRYADFANAVWHAAANARASAEIAVKAADPYKFLRHKYRDQPGELGWSDGPVQVEVSGMSPAVSAEEFQRMLERLTDDQRETFLGLWNIMTGRVPAERPAIEVKAVTE